MIKSIGIVGSGQMGTGISHVCALAGLDVRLVDMNADALTHSLAATGANLDRQVSRGKVSAADKDAALKRIQTSTDLAFVKDCDLVIEAATENEAVKKELFRKLSPTLKPSALIATNTSSISITRLAAATDRPAKLDRKSTRLNSSH